MSFVAFVANYSTSVKLCAHRSRSRSLDRIRVYGFNLFLDVLVCSIIMEETDVQAENRQLKELLNQALERNRLLEEELRRLKGRSSKNSSLPPSSDIGKPNSSNTPNRGGAVKGHPGAQRQMLSSERVDATVSCSLDKCPACGKD